MEIISQARHVVTEPETRFYINQLGRSSQQSSVLHSLLFIIYIDQVVLLGDIFVRFGEICYLILELVITNSLIY